MFNWFVLQPGSIAALAQFALSFVLLLYIVNIRSKSSDSRLFLLFAITSTFYYFIAIIYFSRIQLEENGPLFWLHGIALAVFQLSIVPFAYNFRGNPFKQEAKIVYPLFVALTAVTLYFNSFNIPINWAWYMVMIAWVVGVYLRKAMLAARAKHDATVNASPPNTKLGIGGILTLIRRPPNRLCKAFLALAWWNTIVVVIWFNVNLMGVGILPHSVWNPLHNSLLLVVQMYLVINFIAYADVRTTFLVKLVALSLSAVLVLLGIMGFLLYQSNTDNPVVSSQHVLRILALLIGISTVVIVVGFPLYFRKNLLEPLNQIVAGVGKVAAGDLNVKVQVEVADEIGYLASHFNTMTDSLRKYSEEMESLVARRTEELERSLTDLKAAQAQLIHAEKMASLGELTAGIAHEIQNPLNFVNNFSEISVELMDDLKKEVREKNNTEVISLANEISDNLQKVVAHGKRADGIVKGMLQHSRASTGEKHPTDINVLVDEYLRLSYQAMRTKDKSFQAQLITNFDRSIAKVNVVPQDIGRVLLNIFQNAFYAVNEKKERLQDSYQSKVTITTRSRNEHVEIVVSDNGNGIPQPILDKIFQPFFTTKPTGQGTGLGLSLSYDIVANGHGGELLANSKEGEGAEFLLRLPRGNGSIVVPNRQNKHQPPLNV